MSNNDLDNDRLCATWYAFGRQDAEHNPLVDVFDFAVFYAAQRPTRGQSVQDAFATYVAAAEYEAQRKADPSRHIRDSLSRFD